jgi:hypothetical protein
VIACAVNNVVRNDSTIDSTSSQVAAGGLANLAAQVQSHALDVSNREKIVAAVRLVRQEGANALQSTDANLVVIARDGGALNSAIALEAMGSLCARGRARTEMRDFVVQWRADRTRASSAMLVMATDATSEELELFDYVISQAFEECKPSEYASLAARAGLGRSVDHWIQTLSALGDEARLKEVAQMAANVGVYGPDYPDSEAYWNPLCRRAARELRKHYDLDPTWTLLTLKSTSLIPVDEPGRPAFRPTDPEQRKEIDRKRHEGLISLLPESALPLWESLNH